MKRIQINWMLVLTLLIGVGTGTSFVNKNQTKDCRKVLSEYVAQMAAVVTPRKGKVYHLDFQINAQKQDEKKPKSTRTKIYLSEKEKVYESDQYSFYQDEQDVFVVLHPQKQIIISDELAQKDIKSVFQQMVQLQNNIVQKGKIMACYDTKLNGVTLMKIQLELGEEEQRLYQAQEVTFYFDEAANTMHKVAIQFNDGHPLSHQEVIYHEINFNYKGFDRKPVRDILYSKSGQLQAPYATYKVLNTTK